MWPNNIFFYLGGPTLAILWYLRRTRYRIPERTEPGWDVKRGTSYHIGQASEDLGYIAFGGFRPVLQWTVRGYRVADDFPVAEIEGHGREARARLGRRPRRKLEWLTNERIDVRDNQRDGKKWLLHQVQTRPWLGIEYKGMSLGDLEDTLKAWVAESRGLGIHEDSDGA
mmetsp:Transcript_29186/g.90298  ORF Transcript_29186/g.90298 Transcript_29186/m.90298 type:complete len:169 (-) Transcript_29186:34-540(-)